MLDEITLSEQEQRLMANAIESAAHLVNAAIGRMNTRPRAALSQSIFEGSKISLHIDLAPHPAIRGTVENGDESTELFAVTFPDETPPAILN